MEFRNAYLVLAIAGAIIPFAFFLQHFQTSGFGAGNFVRAVFSNPAASGFTADLLISSLVFWVVMFRQRLRRKGPSPLPFILLNLLIGLSCALPAWLYARSARANVE
jgi:hypothetical protein